MTEQEWEEADEACRRIYGHDLWMNESSLIKGPKRLKMGEILREARNPKPKSLARRLRAWMDQRPMYNETKTLLEEVATRIEEIDQTVEQRRSIVNDNTAIRNALETKTLEIKTREIEELVAANKILRIELNNAEAGKKYYEDETAKLGQRLKSLGSHCYTPFYPRPPTFFYLSRELQHWLSNLPQLYTRID